MQKEIFYKNEMPILNHTQITWKNTKKWAENKFQVYENNINELEREIFELKQDIRHLEEEDNVFEIEHQNIESAYITTDRQTYGLGDIVYVTGKLMDSLTIQLLNGTIVYPAHENIHISIITPENGRKLID